MKQIDVKSDAWTDFIEEIVRSFKFGELIPHAYLRIKFMLEDLRVNEYSDTEEFISAYQIQQFAYMSLVDTLRWQLLKEKSLFLKNVRGDGYTILPSKEQVTYGYSEFMDTVKAAIKRADLIMNNVQPVTMEQQALDNDLRAKCSMLKQMLLSVRK